MQNKANLQRGWMEINACVKREYENTARFEARKNKANSKLISKLHPPQRWGAFGCDCEKQSQFQ